MKFRWIFFLPIPLLTACFGFGDDVRGRSLAGLDLSNMELVRELGEGLSSADRAMFSTYVAVHAPTSPSFCGERLVGRDGREPLTVGEAIDMTQVRDFEIRLARAEEAKPLTAAQTVRRQQTFTTNQRDTMSDRQTLLYTRYGDAARQMPEWSALERQKAEYNRQLSGMTVKEPSGV